MGKIQPFKALGGVLKTAAPFASMIPGVGSLWGAGAGMLGGLLDPARQGGGGGQGGSPYGTNAQAQLLAPLMALLNDPGAAKAGYDRDAFGTAAQRGAQYGGMVASQTGQPGAEQAISLGQLNRATESSNQFGRDVYSPVGRAQLAQSIMGLMQGVNQQHLAQKQINMEYQRPTVAENFLNAGVGALPWILDQIKNRSKGPAQPQQPSGSPGFGLGNNIGNGIWNPGNNNTYGGWGPLN